MAKNSLLAYCFFFDMPVPCVCAWAVWNRIAIRIRGFPGLLHEEGQHRTTIDDFHQKKELKITSLPHGAKLTRFWSRFFLVYHTVPCTSLPQISRTQWMMPGLQNYPRGLGLGKGSSAAIVGAWPESILTPLTESDVSAPCLTYVLFTR